MASQMQGASVPGVLAAALCLSTTMIGVATAQSPYSIDTTGLCPPLASCTHRVRD